MSNNGFEVNKNDCQFYTTILARTQLVSMPMNKFDVSLTAPVLESKVIYDPYVMYNEIKRAGLSKSETDVNPYITNKDRIISSQKEELKKL